MCAKDLSTVAFRFLCQKRKRFLYLINKDRQTMGNILNIAPVTVLHEQYLKEQRIVAGGKIETVAERRLTFPFSRFMMTLSTDGR